MSTATRGARPLTAQTGAEIYMTLRRGERHDSLPIEEAQP